MAQDTTQATQHPSVHTREQEPSGKVHRKRNSRHRACTSGNSSQVAEDTAHKTQHTEGAHR